MHTTHAGTVFELRRSLVGVDTLRLWSTVKFFYRAKMYEIEKFLLKIGRRFFFDVQSNCWKFFSSDEHKGVRFSFVLCNGYVYVYFCNVEGVNSSSWPRYFEILKMKYFSKDQRFALIWQKNFFPDSTKKKWSIFQNVKIKVRPSTFLTPSSIGTYLPDTHETSETPCLDA